MKTLFLIYLLVLISVVYGRKYNLKVQHNEHENSNILLSKFGFYEGGVLNVKLENFHVQPDDDRSTYGLTLVKMESSAENPYDDTAGQCILDKNHLDNQSGLFMYFIMNLKTKFVELFRSKDWRNLHMLQDCTEIPTSPTNSTQGCKQLIPMQEAADKTFSFNFSLYVVTKEEEGSYNLFFHSCPKIEPIDVFQLSFDADIFEENRGSFLSAGEMPLPTVYFFMSIVFFFMAIFWLFILRTSRYPIFKVHYLMSIDLFLKSIALVFHAIHYHCIEIEGKHDGTWTSLYYVFSLLYEGAFLGTIILIGTGLEFYKTKLSTTDKMLFLTFIPLKVLLSLAEILLSEKGDQILQQVFRAIDFLAGCFILFFIYWSVNTLKRISRISTVHLKKQKLFTHFFILLAAYMYSTKIVAYLIQISVEFQYDWIETLFKEMITYAFFVLMGSFFRPSWEKLETSATTLFQFDRDDQEDLLASNTLE